MNDRTTATPRWVVAHTVFAGPARAAAKAEAAAARLAATTVTHPPRTGPCTAVLLPLGSAPVEPCVVDEPHTVHVTADGHRWTDTDQTAEGAHP
ncbi:hypothetical protein ACIQU5_27885 [Streptomyces sp. NPDC090306]|uniref:hypothetical protein n=1 Tax=Streptomyces sp. NPDC090306 TaxID=3365961 RepID=UPI0037F152DA